MQKLKKSIYTAFIASGLSFVPQLASAASLLDALQQAYNSNPGIQAKREQLNADKQLPKIAFSQFLPTASFNYSYHSNSFNYPAPGLNSSTGGISFNMQQNLFNGMRSFNGYLGATMQLNAKKLNFASAEQDFLLKVVQVYSSVYESRQIVGLLEQSLKTLKQQLRSEEAQFAAGQGTKISVAQASSGVAQAQAALSQAQATLKSNEATYRQIVGVMPDSLKVPEVLLKMPSTFSEVLKLAMEKHPAILAASYMVKAAEYNLRVSEGAFSPSVSVSFSHSRDDSNWDKYINDLKLVVSAPIFSGGVLVSQVKQARANLSAITWQYDSIYSGVQQSLASDWANLLGVQAALNADEANVKASTIASDGVRAQNRVGQATTLDVLLQHNNLIRAQIALVQDQQRLLRASYSLLHSMGELKPELLGISYSAVSDKVTMDTSAPVDPWQGLR